MHLESTLNAVERLKALEENARVHRAAAKIQQFFYRAMTSRIRRDPNYRDAEGYIVRDGRRRKGTCIDGYLSDSSHKSLFFSSSESDADPATVGDDADKLGADKDPGDVTDSSSGSANDSDDYMDAFDPRNEGQEEIAGGRPARGGRTHAGFNHKVLSLIHI